MRSTVATRKGLSLPGPGARFGSKPGKSVTMGTTIRRAAIHLSLALAALLLICSCASMKGVLEGKPARERFSRSYPMGFAIFHPRLNSALQAHAKKNRGNSFQVTRLGSDAVIIQGTYTEEKDRGRFSATITVKPAGSGKTWMEIILSPESSGGSPEEAAKELFRIAERGVGVGTRSSK